MRVVSLILAASAGLISAQERPQPVHTIDYETQALKNAAMGGSRGRSSSMPPIDHGPGEAEADNERRALQMEETMRLTRLLAVSGT